MNRRDLLRTVGLGGAAMLARPALSAVCPTPSTWGEITCALNWNGATPATKVLEIFLWGGMAPYESFYYRPGGGGTRGFDADVAALPWNTATSCGTTPSGLVTQVHGPDSAGKTVHLGPFARPLWRSDLASRLRVMVLAHEFQPHEAAIPYNLTGRLLGRPDFSGLGAPIQHRGRALDVTSSHPLPFSYGLLTGFGATTDYFKGVGEVASHGGASKPLILKVDGGFGSFVTQLARPSMSSATNTLLEHYRAQWRDLLRFVSTTPVTRSRAFADYDAAVAALLGAPDLQTLLTAAPTAVIPMPACTRDPGEPLFPTGTGTTEAQLELAAYLLTRPGASSAHYACVVDGGIDGTGFAYDVHGGGPQSQVRRTSCHLWTTLNKLASLINTPGEGNPDKINLDDTLIIIKTEFGRTPHRTGGDGRDHWPEGYCWALLGGPIQTGHHGVKGSIIDDGPPDAGIADDFYTPTDISAAALLAAGIDPFAPGNFQLGQLSASLQGVDHEATMQNLLTTILGV